MRLLSSILQRRLENLLINFIMINILIIIVIIVINIILTNFVMNIITEITIYQEFSPLSPAPLTSSRSMDWGPGFEDQHDNITISRWVNFGQR